MKQDHSITDILTSLKQSVGDEAWKEDQPTTETIVDREFSIDELQERLKMQYGDSPEPLQTEGGSSDLSYQDMDMDTSDFLETDESSDMSMEASPHEESIDETPQVEMPEEEPEEELEAEEEYTYDDSEETLEDESSEEDEELMDEEYSSEEEEVDEPEDKEDETELDEAPIPIDVPENEETANLLSADLAALLLEYETSQTEEDVSALFEEEEEETPAIRPDPSAITSGVFDLMLQCGCEDELEAVTEAETPDDLEEAEDSTEDSIPFFDRVEAIKQSFKKQKIYGAIRLGIMALIVIRLFLYEYLPLMGIAGGGIADYRKYPGSYMLLGLQILLLCAAFVWRQIFDGIKNGIRSFPNVYTLISVLLVGVSTYDVLMLVISPNVLTPQFHFALSALIFATEISEYISLWQNEKIVETGISFFEQSDTNHYTLIKSEGRYSVAEKMHQEGIGYSKNIYAPSKVDLPNDLVTTAEPCELSMRWMRWMIPTSVLLSVIAFVVAVMLNRTWHESAIMAMSVLMVTFPWSVLVSITASMVIATKKLRKRGIILTSEDAVKRYSQADVMIFSDFHLFKNCESKHTGIRFYEEDQCELLLSCLKTVYSMIDSPIASAFASIPELHPIHSVKILRITQGEMEILLDKKHVLLVGDAMFMRSYGLYFPEDATDEHRTSIYVSLDGKASAKLSVAYTVEPIFEMIAERLTKEGVECIVETYDPMICADLVASLRQGGTAPVSIIHKNVSDLSNRGKKKKARGRESLGVLVQSSRLKLAEALVWCKRLMRFERYANWLSLAWAVIGVVSVMGWIGLGGDSSYLQYWLLSIILLSNISAVILAFLSFPKKKHFSLEAFLQEQEKLSRSSK